MAGSVARRSSMINNSAFQRMDGSNDVFQETLAGGSSYDW